MILQTSQFRATRSSQIPPVLADVRIVDSYDQMDRTAVSGFSPVMPHSGADASAFSQSPQRFLYRQAVWITRICSRARPEIKWSYGFSTSLCNPASNQ